MHDLFQPPPLPTQFKFSADRQLLRIGDHWIDIAVQHNLLADRSRRVATPKDG
jgi:hypothetical protein